VNHNNHSPWIWNEEKHTDIATLHNHRGMHWTSDQANYSSDASTLFLPDPIKSINEPVTTEPWPTYDNLTRHRRATEGGKLKETFLRSMNAKPENPAHPSSSLNHKLIKTPEEGAMAHSRKIKLKILRITNIKPECSVHNPVQNLINLQHEDATLIKQQPRAKQRHKLK
jgi:hypothetical protein